jgi:hypothetical protein
MKQRTTLVVVALALVGIFATYVLLRRGHDAALPETKAENAAERGKPRARATGPTGDDAEATEEGVRVVGRVVGEDQAAIPGAVVSLLEHRAEAPAEVVRSDPGGAWVADAIEPGTYSVSATATGFLPGVIRRVEIGAESEPIVLTLAAGGHRLHGTVNDVTGGTVDGARVRATPLSLLQTRDLDGFGTLADADGAYEMFVAPGRYRIDVTHPDYAAQARTIEVGEGTRAQDFELTPTGVIEGVVVRAGSREPVPQAWVAYSGERRIAIGPEEQLALRVGAGSVRADAQGRFRIRGLQSGTISLHARARGVASHEPTIVPLAIAEHVEVEVEVDEAFTVRGRVIASGDPDTPVVGAEVSLGGPESAGASATSGADGAFAIEGVLPGPTMVVASAEGWLTAFPGVRIDVGGETDEVLLELERGRSIVGRVEPPQVAEVTIELRPENLETGGAGLAFGAGPQTESAADGTFTLTPVSDGRTTVVARTVDGLEGEATVTVGEGEPAEVVVRLEPRATVRGVVVGGGGEPVAEALVAMRRIREDGSDIRLEINGRDVGARTGSSTDAGAFVIGGLTKGEYEITVTDRWGDPLAVEGGVAAARGRGTLRIASVATVDVQIVVDAHDGVIAGVVKTAEGEPAADVWVSATPLPSGDEPEEPPPEGRTRRSEMKVVLDTGDGAAFGSRPPVLTGEDGTFEIRGLDDVEHLVVAEQAGGTARVRKTVKPDAKLTLELAPLGSIRGTVTVDGRAADGFVVSAHGPTARTRRVRGAGTFELERLDPGQYRVEARNLEGSGSATVQVEAGRTAEATIALQHFITVTGRVVDGSGQPIAGLEAMIGEGEDGRVSITSDGTEPSNPTGPDGRFEVQCAAGKRVIVFMDPGKPPPRAVEFFTAELGKSPLDLGDIVEQELAGVRGRE